jgi:hypothetical protein
MSYSKFKNGEECAYPERTICNYCDCGKLNRCEYMKCISMGNWTCVYNKPTIVKEGNETANEQKEEINTK